MSVQAQKCLPPGAPPINHPSPLCTFPACHNPALLPGIRIRGRQTLLPFRVPPPPPPTPPIDSVRHILLECHRHDDERQDLLWDLRDEVYWLPLTVAFITGTVSTAFAPRAGRTATKLALTAAFLYSVIKKRALDPLLSPFISYQDDT